MGLTDYIAPENAAVRLDKIRFRTARRLGIPGLLCPTHAAFLSFCDAHREQSHAQLGQDLFVLHALGAKHGGYFVDFGATDGVSLSNSCLLERGYGWKGICAEPSRRWHRALRENRACDIDERCVWSESGRMLQFSECDEGEYSTLSTFVDSDSHAMKRRNSSEYAVKTVSLVDLLEEHGAPAEIDYLSIDTEGSELEILAAHDFERFRFRVITVEHNLIRARRNQIARLLRAHGYRRTMPALTRWDDWYVLRGT